MRKSVCFGTYKSWLFFCLTISRTVVRDVFTNLNCLHFLSFRFIFVSASDGRSTHPLSVRRHQWERQLYPPVADWRWITTYVWSLSASPPRLLFRISKGVTVIYCFWKVTKDRDSVDSFLVFTTEIVPEIKHYVNITQR